jgi:hypothetical protein
MEWKETTKKHKIHLQRRFRYYELSNGNGGVYFQRSTRRWYKPIESFGNLLTRILYKFGVPSYDKKIWWIRNNILFQ